MRCLTVLLSRSCMVNQAALSSLTCTSICTGVGLTAAGAAAAAGCIDCAAAGVPCPAGSDLEAAFPAHCSPAPPGPAAAGPAHCCMAPPNPAAGAWRVLMPGRGTAPGGMPRTAGGRSGDCHSAARTTGNLAACCSSGDACQTCGAIVGKRGASAGGSGVGASAASGMTSVDLLLRLVPKAWSPSGSYRQRYH